MSGINSRSRVIASLGGTLLTLLVVFVFAYTVRMSSRPVSDTPGQPATDQEPNADAIAVNSSERTRERTLERIEWTVIQPPHGRWSIDFPLPFDPAEFSTAGSEDLEVNCRTKMGDFYVAEISATLEEARLGAEMLISNLRSVARPKIDGGQSFAITGDMVGSFGDDLRILSIHCYDLGGRIVMLTHTCDSLVDQRQCQEVTQRFFGSFAIHSASLDSNFIREVREQ